MTTSGSSPVSRDRRVKRRATQARRQPPFAHRNLPLLLLQARERVIARFRPLLNANGVTEQQWRIVRALLETGPLEPRQIVALCGISSPSLAGILTRMEEVGLVRRVRLDHDQRRLEVSLTPKSRALAAAMAPQVEAAYAELEAAVGPELVAQVYRLLDRLVGALDAEAGPGAPSA
ncbi:MAG: homoprotocatechuate degradation operon regulator HpaR [Burkholderiaceae bacterium]|nr:homoprotocatechuate degradation operon regulator HpaR [Burkholderiaceae bacterium]